MAGQGNWLVAALVLSASVAVATSSTASADNRGLNNGVVENVYALRGMAGCTENVIPNPQLRLAAQRHTTDLMHNRALNGDTGSDGTTASQRAEQAGYRGDVAETIAIHPALAISSLELLNLWFHNPAYHAIMVDCSKINIGVWSENSWDRTVVVAVFGRPVAE